MPGKGRKVPVTAETTEAPPPKQTKSKRAKKRTGATEDPLAVIMEQLLDIKEQQTENTNKLGSLTARIDQREATRVEDTDAIHISDSHSTNPPSLGQHQRQDPPKGQAQSLAARAQQYLTEQGLSDEDEDDNAHKPLRKAKKSGYGKTAHDRVTHDVDWPHHFVQRSGGQPPTYDNLSIPEFVSGFLRIIERGPSTAAGTSLVYLREIMDDASNWTGPSCSPPTATFCGV